MWIEKYIDPIYQALLMQEVLYLEDFTFTKCLIAWLGTTHMWEAIHIFEQVQLKFCKCMYIREAITTTPAIGIPLPKYSCSLFVIFFLNNQAKGVVIPTSIEEEGEF